MDARLIAAAIPVFFLLMFIERVLLRKRADPAYRLHDSIADLSCGVGEQAVQLFTFVLELGLYTLVYTHLRVYTFSPSSPLHWVLLILLVDVAYYWFHRASHRVNVLWAIHGVHHQSEEFNYSVALRQGWLEPLAIAPFHMPIALLGFPPAMFFTAFTAHTLWQFWPHTRGIGRHAIDRWLNSPANHRVHHAVNPEYLDKNYSGMLIVWDRLFGTWTPENQEPAYGTVKPLSSWNPLWANLSGWSTMLALARGCPRLLDKVSVPFRPPEWRPAALGGPYPIPQVSRATQVRYRVSPPRAIDAYAIGLFLLVLGASSGLVRLSGPWSPRIAAAALTIVSLCVSAGLIEGKAWAKRLEIARLLSLAPAAYVIAMGTGYERAAALGGAALMLVQGIWFALAIRRATS